MTLLVHLKIYLYLQHTEGSTPVEEGEEERLLPSHDPHIKRESPVEANAPVKHILVMETKPEPRNSTAPPDKMWDKLACQVCGQMFKTVSEFNVIYSTVLTFYYYHNNFNP